MLRVLLTLSLIAAVLLPGCASSGGKEVAEPAANQPAVETEFARMLGFVPYSFLKERDIWFSNPGKAKQLYGLDNIKSLDDVMELPTDEIQRVLRKLSGVAGLKMDNNHVQIAPLVGFDGMMVSRTVFHEEPPPWGFSVLEGDFDEDVIAGKLAEQGYEKAEYGSYTYHAISGDYELKRDSEIAMWVLAELNRVAVLDDTIVTAPATDILTGILDSMAGNEAAVIDNAACRALAESMGEVLSAVIITADRVFEVTSSRPAPPVNFTIPDDWGRLHQYDMVGMGYRDDGQERFWVISLYYSDAEAASADAGELVKRMKSYSFTGFEPMANVTPLTLKFEVGEPKVQKYPGGATLTVESRFNPETGSSAWYMPAMWTRDFLFLAPDPSLFVGQ